ncbi:MAG TPA: hypothetical protein VJ978_04955, partial [Nitriliruptoraceae bacterium]|nr:hypothetical protein [Nitriliruptoraceae bacterium]
HEMDRLREWMDTVPPPPPLDSGADAPAEVADAIAAKQKELDAARDAAEAKAAESDASKDEGGSSAKPAAKSAGSGKPNVADVHVEGAGEQLDQEVYDSLIAEGKSERMARAKAKAAWVRAQKKAKMAEQEAAEGGGSDAAADAEAAAPAKPSMGDIHVEGAGEQLDQEVYDSLIAEGKSERMARAKAKAAWVRAQKKAKMAEADSGGSAEAADDAGGSAEDASDGGDA